MSELQTGAPHQKESEEPMSWGELDGSAGVSATPERLSVLIVEDEAPIRETLREFFIGKNFGVTVARNGEQAEELLRGERTFELVLTDLRLPVGDGVEILRQARARNPTGYVILMTGFASLESALEAVRLGAFEYLVKPFSLSELDLTLDRVTEHRFLADTNRRLNGEVEQLRPLRDLDRNQRQLQQTLQELTSEVRRQRELVERLARSQGVDTSDASDDAGGGDSEK